MKGVGAYPEENKNHLERHLLQIRLLNVPPGKQRLSFCGKWLGAISASLEGSESSKNSKFLGLSTSISSSQVSGSHSFLGIFAIQSDPWPDFEQSLPAVALSCSKGTLTFRA